MDAQVAMHELVKFVYLQPNTPASETVMSQILIHHFDKSFAADVNVMQVSSETIYIDPHDCKSFPVTANQHQWP